MEEKKDLKEFELPNDGYYVFLYGGIYTRKDITVQYKHLISQSEVAKTVVETLAEFAKNLFDSVTDPEWRSLFDNQTFDLMNWIDSGVIRLFESHWAKFTSSITLWEFTLWEIFLATFFFF